MVYTVISDFLASFLQRMKSKPKGVRSFQVNRKGVKKQYCNNYVSTTKYSIISFIPKNLFEQFTRVANLYFLFISCLQLFTDLSPTGRFGTAPALAFVLIFQAAKDIYEDVKRYSADREANHRKVKRMNCDKKIIEKILWMDVRVGDIIVTEEDEPFAADMICLSSSDSQGLCFVETSQLDGETNLKIRKSLPATIKLSEDDKLFYELDASIQCEPPNDKLYHFEGTISLRNPFHDGCDLDNKKSRSIHPISSENILLRGSSLRNCKCAYGLVVYTGRETKIMLNMRNPPHKMSRIELKTNIFVLCVFIALFVMATISTLGNHLWKLNYATDVWYIFPQLVSFPHSEMVRNWFTFFILYSMLIPISLYVSMELVKTFQARLFIDQDLLMYDQKSNTPAKAKTSSLNEELGAVEYILSDKTGTLTQNKMIFAKFWVDGQTYGSKNQSNHPNLTKSRSKNSSSHNQVENNANFKSNGNDFVFFDERINSGNWKLQRNSKELYRFFQLLALCHTVIPKHIESELNADVSSETKIVYQSSSPDEFALVQAANEFGISCYERSFDHLTLLVDNEKRRYEILNILEFDSTRKRMSIILKCPDDSILLLCKGADSVLLPLIKKKPQTFNQEQYLKELDEVLRDFASQGLRTLVCAQKKISYNEWKHWNDNYFNPANISLEDREAKAYEIMERTLSLVGISAIEDKLQDEVPETIALLSAANIKFWVLTGDKQETAINIGFSCSMLYEEMNIVILNEPSKQYLISTLQYHIASINNGNNLPGKSQENGIVIDCDTLQYILDDFLRLKKQWRFQRKKKPRPHPVELEETSSLTGADETYMRDFSVAPGLFIDLCKRCKSVICCRVSPKQKSIIVKLVRYYMKGSVVMSIGDGANDVPMIQAANIGVGISGEEGLQAARAADYSIAQFRFLQNLLLVHGRMFYRRISILILYFFYKVIVLQLVQFFFSIFNGFSGTSLFELGTLSLYNVIFTSIPILIVGTTDRDVAVKTSLKFPELYLFTQKQYYFNTKIFLYWIFTSVWHAVAAFFIPYVIFSGDNILHEGRNTNINIHGLLVYTAIIIIVNLKVAIETYSWNLVTISVISLQLLVWPIFISIYCSLYPLFPIHHDGPDRSNAYYEIGGLFRNSYFVFFNSALSVKWWLVLFLVVSFVVIIEIAVKSLWRMCNKQLYHIVRETEGRYKHSHREKLERRYPDLLKPVIVHKPR